MASRFLEIKAKVLSEFQCILETTGSNHDFVDISNGNQSFFCLGGFKSIQKAFRLHAYISIYIYLCADRNLVAVFGRKGRPKGLKIGAKSEEQFGAFSVRFWTPSGGPLGYLFRPILLQNSCYFLA